MATVELITTYEALQHWFLPWQVLFGERRHYCWQHPKWWRVCQEQKVAELPFWAVVSAGSSLIGMVPVRRTPQRFRSMWSLDLCPLSGGGVIGSQPTAVLNAVINKLTADGNRNCWDLVYDPNDIYLKNRFELAFQTAKLIPNIARPNVAGWKIESKQQAESGSQPVVECNRPEGEVLWWQTGISSMEVQPQDSPDLEQFETSETRWLDLGSGIVVGVWDVMTSRELGGSRVLADQGTWMPCCVVAEACGQRSVEDISRLIVQGLLDCLGDEIQQWQITETMNAWFTSMGTPVNWPLECQKRRVVAKRWLMQERVFQRPNLWRRFSQSVSG